MIKLVDILKESLSISSAEKAAKDFEADFKAGKVAPIPAGGGKNIGIYSHGNYIIKRVKAARKIEQDDVDTLARRIASMDRVIVPKAIIDLSDGSQAIVMDRATGTSGDKLTDEDIDAIPQQHWDNLLKDIRELSSKGIQTDLTKRSNFFYDNSKGFQLLDIDGASIDGSPTNKFFDKDGEEHYYAYEKYPFMPKKLTSSKDMFLRIPKH